MTHEIGNRTYIVADVEPARRRRRAHARGGRRRSGCSAFLALLPFYGRLEETGRVWWLWTCLAGFGLGLFGLEYCRRRRNRRRAGKRSRSSPGGDRSERARCRPASACRRPARAAAPACCFLQLHLGVGAAAVVERHDPAVVVGVAVGADAEHLRQRAGQPDQEAAGRAGRRAPTGRAASRGRRRRRTTAAAASSRPSSESVRTRPRPRSAATWRICALSSASSGSSPKEYVGTRRGSSSSTGSRSPGRQVAGLDPLAVGHPLGRHDRVVAGDQHDLVDGDLLLARRPGDGDRPAPAAVAGAGAGEVVGDHALALGLVAEVVADVGRADLLERGRRGRRRRHPPAVASGLVRAAVITCAIVSHPPPVSSCRGRNPDLSGGLAARLHAPGRMAA